MLKGIFVGHGTVKGMGVGGRKEEGLQATVREAKCVLIYFNREE